MDFFAQQQLTKTRSLALLLCFASAMLLIAVCVNIAASSVSYLLGAADTFWHMSGYALLITGLLWFAIVAGCLFRWMDVRAGGDHLAQRFGAVPVLFTSRRSQEKMLLDIVAEMSVAANHPAPTVWIIKAETSINAFVVGGVVDGKNDVALVVTGGLLERLDRDEVQAVVAHEFGHLRNGDLLINMRLLIAMGGLMAIDEVGLTLAADGRENPPPWFIVGWLLRFFGGFGILLANVIRSAFSRKREYLADACAAQYTRNPTALASALVRISSSEDHGVIHSRYANELAHLCFQVPPVHRWFTEALATHPPVEERISAIDPHFMVKARIAKRLGTEHAEALKSTGLQSTMPAVGSAIEVNHDSGISERFELMLPDVTSCLAGVFAMFACTENTRRENYLGSIAFAYGRKFSIRVEALYQSLGAELQSNRLLALEYIAPRLREKTQPENRYRLLKNLEKLIEIEGEASLPNFAAVQLLRHRLDADFPLLTKVVVQANHGCDHQTQQAQGTKLPTLNGIEQHIALLLSLMVEASGNSEPRLDREFSRVLRCYTSASLPRRSSTEAGIVEQMQTAFHALSAQPRVVRESFVDHCREIAQVDHFTTEDESMLLDLFAASLELDLMDSLVAA